MLINTVTQQAPQQLSDKHKPTCHHCKKPSHYQNQCRQLNREKDQPRNNTKSANINNGSAQTNSNPNKKFQTIPKLTIQIIKEKEDLDLFFHPVRHVVESTTPQRSVTLEQTQQRDHLPGIGDRRDKTKSSREMHKTTQMEMSKLQPKI